MPPEFFPMPQQKCRNADNSPPPEKVKVFLARTPADNALFLC